MSQRSVAVLGANHRGERNHDEAEPSPGGENSARGAVLVVDDEPLIRWSLRQGLTRSGYDVVEADSAAQALAAIAAGSHSFGVVILDYRLPDRRDLSLLREIRALLPDAAVLMMTAHGDEDMRTQAHALGVRAVVDKPFQVAAFVALVNQCRSR